MNPRRTTKRTKRETTFESSLELLAISRWLVDISELDLVAPISRQEARMSNEEPPEPVNTWVARAEGCDFRQIKWGMTQAAIRETEPDMPTSVMPGSLLYDTAHEGLELTVMYQFVEEDGEVFCVAASAQTKASVGMEMIGPMGYMTPPDCPESPFEAREKAINQLLRDGADISEVNRLRQQHLRESAAEAGSQSKKTKAELSEEMEQEFLETMGRTEVDHTSVESDYERLKQLMTTEYGAPELEDGPVVEDPEYLDAITNATGDVKPDSMSDLKSTTWRTPTTRVDVSIKPIPFGGRVVAVSLMSVVHGRFFLATRT